MNACIKEFVSEIKGGNSQLMVALWQQFAPLIKNWSYKTPLEGYTLDDLSQQSFILLLKALEEYDPGKGVPFEAFYRMRLYSWRSLAFRKKTESPMADEKTFELLSNKQDPAQDIEEIFAQKEDKDLLYTLLNTLEEKERYILQAYYFHHMELKAIAKELGYSYKSLEAKKRRLLTKLRILYKKSEGLAL